jgi:hypothetical protein
VRAALLSSHAAFAWRIHVLTVLHIAALACSGVALAIELRLNAPRPHAREAAAATSFNDDSWPLAGAWLPQADDAPAESDAAPRGDVALAALRALICAAAATPFLLFEEVDYASLGSGDDGADDDDAVRAWLHGKAAGIEALHAQPVLFRPQRALAARCASAADAAALRALLHEQHGLRVQCLAAMPDVTAIASAVAAADAAAKAAAAPQRSFNPHAASFCPAAAATTTAAPPSTLAAVTAAAVTAAAAASVPAPRAPLPGAPRALPPSPSPQLAWPWSNAQLVPMAPQVLQSCLLAGTFTLPESALAMRGAHGGVRPYPSPPPGGATALFLLDVLTGTLHGVFCAIPTPPASAAHAPAGQTLHAFERRGEPGQPLPLRYAMSALPTLRGFSSKALALSGADAMRLETWMRTPSAPTMQLWPQAPVPMALPDMAMMPSGFAPSPFLMQQQQQQSAMSIWPQYWQQQAHHAGGGAEYGGGGFMPSP